MNSPRSSLAGQELDNTHKEVANLDVAVTADLILATMSAALYRYQRTTCGYGQDRIVAAIRRMCIDGLRHPA